MKPYRQMIIITIQWRLRLFDYPNDSIKFYKIRDCSGLFKSVFCSNYMFCCFLYSEKLSAHCLNRLCSLKNFK